MARPLSLTSDPIVELTWRIAVPTSVGMFFNTLFNFVDTYCAGWLGTGALAALALSFPLFFLLIALGSGMSQGSTALIANALGAGNEQEARNVFAQSLVFAIVVGALFTAIGSVCAPSLFRAFGADGTYLAATLTYMNVILAGSVFFVLTMALNSALSAQGRTTFYRNFLILGFLANCALNPVLMWGLARTPPLGVAGIALATVIVQASGCVLLWRNVKSTPLFADLAPALFRPNLATMRDIAGQSVPAALNMMTIAFGIFVITWFVQQFGKEAVAAVGIATRIEQLVLMPVIGLSTAVLSIVGQSHGAALAARVREAWTTSLKIGVVLMLGGGMILWFGGDALVRVFSNDARVIEYGGDYLKIAALTLAAYPVLFSTVFMMQGLKRPAYGLYIGLYRQVLAPLVVIHVLFATLSAGIASVWFGVMIVNWSAAVFAFWWGNRVTRVSVKA